MQPVSPVEVYNFRSSLEGGIRCHFVISFNLISLPINERGLPTLTRAWGHNPQWVNFIIKLFLCLDLKRMLEVR